jgi:peptide/nickel transport system substrate-binding protein
VANSSDQVLLAQFIQSEEAAVGINVVIDAVDNLTKTARGIAGTFDTNYLSFPPASNYDRILYDWTDTNGARNQSGYSNPRLDFILANARKATSPKALRILYHAAEEIIAADRPLIYLDHPTVFVAASSAVIGVKMNSDVQLVIAGAQYR